MKKLENKVVIITGAASRIGEQLTIRCAEEGTNLAICSRTKAKLLGTKRIC